MFFFKSVGKKSDPFSTQKQFKSYFIKQTVAQVTRTHICCDMSQNDTIGKIELIPSIVLSSDNTKYKNDIQLFLQLFDESSVYRDYH